MRLFTALWPSSEAVAALDSELVSASLDWPPEGWRRIPPPRWHLMLCFHGDDADPGIEARRLEAALAGRPAPLLRLAGAGFLPRLGYAVVTAAGPADLVALGDLVAGAGAVPDGAALRRRGSRPQRPRLATGGQPAASPPRPVVAPRRGPARAQQPHTCTTPVPGGAPSAPGRCRADRLVTS